MVLNKKEKNVEEGKFRIMCPIPSTSLCHHFTLQPTSDVQQKLEEYLLTSFTVALNLLTTTGSLLLFPVVTSTPHVATPFSSAIY